MNSNEIAKLKAEARKLKKEQYEKAGRQDPTGMDKIEKGLNEIYKILNNN